MANREALRELQTRLASRLQAARTEGSSVSSWLAVESAGSFYLLPLGQSGEIFPWVSIQAVPYTQRWFLGVANLRGQLHGVVDLARFLSMPRAVPAGAQLSEGVRDASRLVAFNAALQVNAALWVDRLMGLRNASALQLMPAVAGEGKPAFVGQCMRDEQGRSWYELNLAALAADESFLKIDA